MKTPLFVLIIAAFALSCSKSSDPAPTTDYGTWSYNGKTYSGVSSNWSGSVLISNAVKPNQSVVSAIFNSNSPAIGTYTIIADPSVSLKSTEVVILLSDLSTPAPAYTSLSSNSGSVTVSRSASTIKVTLNKVQLAGATSTGVDNLEISGTLSK